MIICIIIGIITVIVAGYVTYSLIKRNKERLFSQLEKKHTETRMETIHVIKDSNMSKYQLSKLPKEFDGYYEVLIQRRTTLVFGKVVKTSLVFVKHEKWDDEWQ